MGGIDAAALGAFLVLAVAADVRRRHVPNSLVATFAIIALVVAGVADGAAGVSRSVCGFTLGLALLLVPFVLGHIGAGDAKFLGTIGAFLGPRLTLDAFLVGSVLGGIGALVALHAVRRHTPAIPYTAPLAAGVVVALVLDGVGIGLL